MRTYFELTAACIAALASFLYVLDYFKVISPPPKWGFNMPPSRRWKLGIMLGLVGLSLWLSGYAFYRSLRPKIVEKVVEKPIEKIVEKLVPQECPKPKVTANTKRSEQIHAAPSSPNQSINAQSGIAIGGGVVSNPTVINASPPPASLSFREEVITAFPPNGEGEKELKVHIKTDRSIPGAVVGIICSSPFTLGNEQPTLQGASIEQLSWGSLSRGNPPNPIPNSLGVSINAPSAFVPGQELIVLIKSKADIHVLQVFPVVLSVPQ